MSILQAWRYFRIPSRIPPLPRDLITSFDIANCDEDELLILMSGKAKDRHAIKRLLEKYKVATAKELLALLPRRKPRSLRLRIMDWLRRAEGSYEHDPLRHQLKKPKESHSRVQGISHVKLTGGGSFDESFDI